MKCTSLVVLLLLTIASAGRADAQNDKAAVIKTMTDYYAAWADLGPTFDLQRVLPYYHEPLMLVSPARAIAIMTRAESEAAWAKAFIAVLKERGAVRIELRQLHVKEMSPGVALASVQYVLLKADGQELERRGVIYMLRKTSDGWKIAAAMGHSPDSVLRLD